jgi:peptidoglycan hydrolase-like protein with peptidoglycan-binding domain
MSKLLFSLVVFFQAISLPLVFAETATTGTQSDQPSQIEIQKALAEAGFYQGAIDGIVGPKTRAAIKSFQDEFGLNVDGFVGPNTWEYLKAYFEEAE